MLRLRQLYPTIANRGEKNCTTVRLSLLFLHTIENFHYVMGSSLDFSQGFTTAALFKVKTFLTSAPGDNTIASVTRVMRLSRDLHGLHLEISSLEAPIFGDKPNPAKHMKWLKTEAYRSKRDVEKEKS